MPSVFAHAHLPSDPSGNDRSRSYREQEKFFQIVPKVVTSATVAQLRACCTSDDAIDGRPRAPLLPPACSPLPPAFSLSLFLSLSPPTLSISLALSPPGPIPLHSTLSISLPLSLSAKLSLSCTLPAAQRLSPPSQTRFLPREASAQSFLSKLSQAGDLSFPLSSNAPPSPRSFRPKLHLLLEVPAAAIAVAITVSGRPSPSSKQANPSLPLSPQEAYPTDIWPHPTFPLPSLTQPPPRATQPFSISQIHWPALQSLNCFSYSQRF